MNSTIERLRQLSQRLDPRYMRIDQALEIYRLMRRYPTPPRRVLEIGTYCGTGAILLAAMVEPWHGLVTTVDLPWTGRPNVHFSKTADEWAAELGVENLTIIRRYEGAEGFLRDHFRFERQPWDLIYIDGGHTWVHVCAQFAMAFAALRHGGWLVFDDVESLAWPEVGQCWQRVVCQLVPARDRYQFGQLGFAMRRVNRE